MIKGIQNAENIGDETKLAELMKKFDELRKKLHTNTV
mgnify:FL=1